MILAIHLTGNAVADLRALLEAARHQALLAQPDAGRATEDALCIIYEQMDCLIAELAVAVRSDEDDAQDAAELKQHRRAERPKAWPTVTEWANRVDFT